MALGVWLFVGWMALVALIAFGMFVWGLEAGQFTDVEEPARRMLCDADSPGSRTGVKAANDERGVTHDR